MVNDPRDLPAGGYFERGEHRYPLRVCFADTDAGGVVYHAGYLRFMESARSDMLRLAGIDQAAALAAGEGVYAIADLSIRYLRPARLEDALLVTSRLGAVRGASCVIHQRVMRGAGTLAEASVTAAFVAPDGRPRRQPQGWRDIFERLKRDD